MAVFIHVSLENVVTIFKLQLITLGVKKKKNSCAYRSIMQH